MSPRSTASLRSLILAMLPIVLAVALAATPAGAASKTPAKPAAPSCGTTIYKADGSPWICTFDDEFSALSLDKTKWTAWNGVNYNGSPATCYYDDPSHVYLKNGYLNLAVTKLAAPASCVTPSGTQTSTYGGAVVHTQGHFSQTGGRFEARIKFGGGVGIHDGFWMFPDANTYAGHAEIDVAESWGEWPDTMSAVTHMTGADGTDVGQWQPCPMTGWANGFHTFAVEWTNSAITFVYDGSVCATFSGWTPMAGFQNPAPFDQPFFLILQALADDGTYAPAPTDSTVLPAVTQVDYVRAWK